MTGLTGLHAPWRRVSQDVGHYALMWPTFALFSILGVVSSVFRLLRWGLDQPLYLVVTVVLTTGIFALGALIAGLAVTRLSSRHLLASALLLWSVIALTRYLLSRELTGAFGGQPPDLAVWPVILSWLTVLAWVGLLAGWQAVNFRQQDSARSLQISIDRLRDLTAREWSDLDSARDELAYLVRRTIGPVINQLALLLNSTHGGEANRQFADSVQRVTERSRQLIRDASHDMQGLAGRAKALGSPVFVGTPQEAASQSRSRPRVALQRVRLEPGIAVPVTIVILAISSPALGLTSVLFFGIALPVTYLFLRIIATTAERVHDLFQIPRIVIVVASYFGASVLALLVTNVVMNLVAEQPADSIWMSPRFGIPFLIFVLSISVLSTTVVSLTVADWRQWAQVRVQLADTQRSLDELALDMARQHDRLQAQTASMLHGPIQGRLATIAMLVQFDNGCLSAQTAQSCLDLLNECETDIGRSSNDPRDEYMSIWQLLSDLRRQWTGLLAISWVVEPDVTDLVNGDAGVLRELETTVAELASNASRHGAARHLEFSIALTAHHIRLIARDDGRGPSFPIGQGLGLGELGLGGLMGQSPVITVDPDGWCSVTRTLRRPAAGQPHNTAQRPPIPHSAPVWQ